MSDKLDLILKELQSMNSEIQSMKSKMDIFESNQLTFLQELRELRLENQARDRLFSKELAEVRSGLRYVNRRMADLDYEVDKIKLSMESA